MHLNIYTLSKRQCLSISCTLVSTYLLLAARQTRLTCQRTHSCNKLSMPWYMGQIWQIWLIKADGIRLYPDKAILQIKKVTYHPYLPARIHNWITVFIYVATWNILLFHKYDSHFPVTNITFYKNSINCKLLSTSFNW